ncbi:D-alanyl-D-alanine carboxypeptidase/D-alanyl-D-alanine endopeptidase [Chromobacterium sphagni]|uniref:D-alanyl-D-alanine carboxypeptidase/D-alanyl-D-alanine-endopeptidase n=1 Tax=Chromobacterium sphagni TaxID=1903179 RepID=A0A1S1X3M2_9NEIS|nr:D-alanyl-D-alanine carboxypeptidase/D-alanyl-D-alanine-endopeptidase [Chromobacterium sphagni]OHX14074.1 D-alanyl-D-alanine carboxypeptidase/D-alanyl-D-alanine-endopeptidase [Chromobacterium sphagni]OHX20281.1 D-alanyl-D-alanine carboxypeptidase/D-alanyl-D-alanine-endopeptidase [Chromobacterium sphagni]
MKMTRQLTLLAALAVYAAPELALALDLHGFKPDEIAVWAAAVEGGQPLAAHRADAAVNPASTMKLLTGWAALNRLGPDYRWKTALLSAAPLRGDALSGDLYWLGGGDPRFDNGNLLSLLYNLRLRGVRQLDGKLLLDKRAFSRLASADDFDGDAGKAFVVGPDTHLTNLKVAWLTFFNDGHGARVALDPPLPGVNLQVDVKSGGDEACPDVRRFVAIRNDGRHVSVTGSVPAACDGARAYVNVLEHDEFAGQDFAALWHALGGSGPLTVAQGRAPDNARELAVWQSQPLAVALADINKYSNNTMARTLFLTLGKEAGGGDTAAAAERALREQLAQRRIDDANLLELENGSGLSRRERVSVRLLGEVLLDAARGPYAGEFLASLPIASEDGTLKKRFADLGPRLRMKTGTLRDVKALAGYWQAADGRRLAIVAIVNSPRAAEMGKALDAVVGDLVQAFDPAAARSGANR